ncbi:hypothetical protein CH330_08955 [candidate division WOR-3 bacterium JGI_Cruoil_03_51_56]|uniref:HD/PDEase domain-containing protein n=1 Tax=candidate division WOR-3 bacterium JGI_Cruoil_03_51_56 TaxID=1973747 RepID=A0A235BRY4_UNCW3|nr:MAG: hypothetical protein CH330_08955 [candidate division WOR-3 bacterium JGI_Cruoil_03_51_56]
MKKQFIKNLKPNIPVEDIFFLTRRDIKEKRDGAPFLTFEFQDKTGRLTGIMWDRVEDALRCVTTGGFYHVQGKLGNYQGKPQLTVNAIYPADPDEVSRDDFIATTRYDRSKLLDELHDYFTGIKNPHLKKLLKTFFEDQEFMTRFSEAPGGAMVHHNYLGGLLEHTVFMCRMAKAAAETYKEVDGDLLMTGVMLHDVGKIREYVYDTAIDHTYDGRLIGHVVIGYEMVHEKIKGIEGFPEELSRMLLHIILSHHGHLEFGAPKTPKFAEAFIVYFLDNLDSRVAMFRDVVENNPGTKWTDFHRFLETNVYIKDQTD